MIVLMRHARTRGGRGRCIGRTPLELSSEGRVQAARAAAGLAGCRFARLYSSPARRALDTLAPLAEILHLEPRVAPGLDEIDMGEWDGLAFDEIRARDPEGFAARGRGFASFRPPGGESFADVADRAMEVLRVLAADPQPVLAVTHAGVIRAVLCRLTGHPLDDPFHFSPGYGVCTVVRPGPEGLRLAATGMAPGLLFNLLFP
ncbi:MAG: histidine phosphatase family protein [Pseudodesulfovibrio sp.]